MRRCTRMRLAIRPKLAALALGMALSLVMGAVHALPVQSAPQREARAEAAADPLVMLLTDFGERGYLLGALKGSIYTAAPGVRLDSITNSIERFDVGEAAWVLALAAEGFPPGTVFVAVVSPDRSGPRPPIVLQTRRGHLFVAPDNGLLTQVALRYGVAGIWAVDPAAVAAAGASPFAARDVLGPAAGALARGLPPAALGRPQEALYLLAAPPASLMGDYVEGSVTLIDRFGNVFTNIQQAQLKALGVAPGGTVAVQIGDATFTATWVNTYADVNLLEPLAVMNSWGELKLALNQGDLAEAHHIGEGATVTVRAGP